MRACFISFWNLSPVKFQSGAFHKDCLTQQNKRQLPNSDVSLQPYWNYRSEEAVS